jgi:hypothetical protein
VAHQQLSKELGDMWKALDDAGRAEYNDKYKEAMEKVVLGSLADC